MLSCLCCLPQGVLAVSAVLAVLFKRGAFSMREVSVVSEVLEVPFERGRYFRSIAWGGSEGVEESFVAGGGKTFLNTSATRGCQFVLGRAGGGNTWAKRDK